MSLTVPDLDRLTVLETVIERGIKSFIEVGDALAEVRDSRLYRETHETFEAYCQERWGMGRWYANHLVKAAARDRGLGANAPKPASEGVSRQLATLDREPDIQRAAWAEVVERHGPNPSGPQVREVVEEVQPMTQRDEIRGGAHAKRLKNFVYAMGGYAAGVGELDIDRVQSVMEAGEYDQLTRSLGKALAELTRFHRDLRKGVQES